LVELGLISKKRKSISSLDNFVVRVPSETSKAAKRKLALWAFECCGGVSFNSLTHPAFKEFLNVVGLTGVDRKQLAGEFSDQAHADAAAGVSRMLAEQEYYQMSGDSWKRRNVNDGLKLLFWLPQFP